MSNIWHNCLVGVVIAAVLIGVFVLIGMQAESDQRFVEQWAKNQGLTVVSKEQTLFDSGPFYVRAKNQRIWRVEMRDWAEQRLVYYFRLGGWTNDVEQYR